jgi:hypothetical protein
VVAQRTQTPPKTKSDGAAPAHTRSEVGLFLRQKDVRFFLRFSDLKTDVAGQFLPGQISEIQISSLGFGKNWV